MEDESGNGKRDRVREGKGRKEVEGERGGGN